MRLSVSFPDIRFIRGAGLSHRCRARRRDFAGIAAAHLNLHQAVAGVWRQPRRWL